jgi:hypothetical protein
VALVRAIARLVGLENRNKAQGAGRRAVADFAVITVCGKQHPSIAASCAARRLRAAGRCSGRSSAHVLLRAKGEILGTVEAPDAEAAKAVAAIEFDLDEIQRNRIMVQELA